MLNEASQSVFLLEREVQSPFQLATVTSAASLATAAASTAAAARAAAASFSLAAASAALPSQTLVKHWSIYWPN